MTNMKRELLFLANLPSSQGADDVEYEPFPAEGELKYTTHPAFAYDEGLKVVMEGYAITVSLMVGSGIPSSQIQGLLDWMKGDAPIPDDHWEEMMIGRKKWLKKYKLPLDTPIGRVSAPEPSHT